MSNDPLSVTCPWCDAPPSVPCRTESVAKRKPHSYRLDAVSVPNDFEAFGRILPLYGTAVIELPSEPEILLCCHITADNVPGSPPQQFPGGGFTLTRTRAPRTFILANNLGDFWEVRLFHDPPRITGRMIHDVNDVYGMADLRSYLRAAPNEVERQKRAQLAWARLIPSQRPPLQYP